MKILFALGWIGGGFLLLVPLRGQDAPPDAPDRPFDKNFSIAGAAVISNGKHYKFTVDGTDDAVRLDMEGEGTHDTYPQIVHISEMRIYSLIDQDKAAVYSPYQVENMHNHTLAIPIVIGDFQLIGPEAVDGRNCLKYKGLTDDGGVVFYTWTDAVTHVPLRSISEDGDITVTWSNYKVGPQDPSLFAIPADYKVMRWAEYAALKTPAQ